MLEFLNVLPNHAPCAQAASLSDRERQLQECQAAYEETDAGGDGGAVWQ